MSEDRRITCHAILGPDDRTDWVGIEVDGQKMKALSGEPVLAALLANGRLTCRVTPRHAEQRGAFCGIGRCTDCVMVVDGIANTRTCVTPVKAGMIIRTQKGQER